jgi:hypothetical protein
MTYENLKGMSSEAFKRYSGVKPATFETMLEALWKAERDKKKPGRSPALCLEEQLLLTLSYWREYRTQFHIAASYGIHESTANRIINKVENVLSASNRFALPKRQAAQAAEHELVVVVIDSTETPIERPKKSNVPQAQRQGSVAITAARKSVTH